MDVINSLIKQGVWPNIYKTEYITPIPKVFPPAKGKQGTAELGANNDANHTCSHLF